ncbi:MAG: DUF5706 domain-containing protein [Thermodesulfobacteriota bacterium]|nr:DUF5706 domain-containing protein [Thermodesulfobacteriota bacterium]
MKDEEKILFLENNLTRLLSEIHAAEARVRTLSAISIAMLGVLAALAPVKEPSTILGLTFWSMASLFLVGSLLMTTFASFPRTKVHRDSIIYFRGICTKDMKEYINDVKKFTMEEYIDDLTRQCHRSARIATRKFVWLQRAMMAIYLCILPWAGAIYIFYGCKI